MDKSELWIGEKVILLISQRKGIYLGENKEGKCRVRIGDNKIIVTSYSNIVIQKEERIKKAIHLKPAFPKEPRIANFNPTIDLHIEKLDTDLQRQPVQMILRQQIKQCKNHIEKAIQVGAKTIIIIHGIGKGELKKEVEFLLSQYSEVQFYNTINNGGATEVWMR